jgi:hypothetical protein
VRLSEGTLNLKTRVRFGTAFVQTTDTKCPRS